MAMNGGSQPWLPNGIIWKPYKILMPGLPPENLECGIGIGILKSSPRDLIGQSRLGVTGEAGTAAW